MPTALVTGGATGIGRATVARLAAEGYEVFAASRTARARTVPDGVVAVDADLRRPEAAQELVDEVVATSGRLDVLVNNAGAHVLAPFEETSPADVEAIFEVNLFGPLRLARAAVPVMRAAGSGRIVNVTSIADVLPTPFSGYYCASKAAMSMASAVLHAELDAFGISVAVIAPGLHRTDMAERLGHYRVPDTSPYAEVVERFTARERELWPTAADPDDAAAVIVECIAGDRSRMVAGADDMESLMRRSSAEDYATLITSFLRRLVHDGAAPPG